MNSDKYQTYSTCDLKRMLIDMTKQVTELRRQLGLVEFASQDVAEELSARGAWTETSKPGPYV